MKRVILAIAAGLTFAASAWATTTTYTVKGSVNNKAQVSITTVATGDILVEATVTKPTGKTFVLKITDAAEDVRTLCSKVLDSRYNGLSFSCLLSDAPAGAYKAWFWSFSGASTATLTITAETG